MECTGVLNDVSRDWKTGKWKVTFAINEESALSQIENIQSCEKLSITAEKFSQKRSLTANAYFHVLVGKIAEAKTQSKAWAKNELICKYGQPQYVDGDVMIYKTNAPVEFMRELEYLHSTPVKFSEENGKEVVFYKIYRGSSTYNTQEMSALIDGTVAEAKEHGIDTLPTTELEKMKALWSEHEKNRTN